MRTWVSVSASPISRLRELQSAEMDIVCFICGGTGCNVANKPAGWKYSVVGMVHPKVLANQASTRKNIPALLSVWE